MHSLSILEGARTPMIGGLTSDLADLTPDSVDSPQIFFENLTLSNVSYRYKRGNVYVYKLARERSSDKTVYGFLPNLYQKDKF